MQPDLDGMTCRKRQPKIQCLGVSLDASEFAQAERTVMFGRAPHLDYELENGSCAGDCPDCTHRNLRRRYRAAVRARVIARGHKADRRIDGSKYGLALKDKLNHALARFHNNDPHA